MASYYYYYPRTSQSFFRPPTTRFYQPSFPCSYFQNDFNPLYGHPYYYSPQNHSVYEVYEDYEDDQEPSERFYERKAKKDRQQRATNDTTNHQPKKSFKVKISGDDDQEEEEELIKKSTIKKSQAALKIINFIKHQMEKKQIRQILNKLHELRAIENELKEIHQTKSLGNLTFKKEYERQVLPISVENKRFLEYENQITKSFDKLDNIQSGGVDIIRERRKSIVKFTQTLLEELDNEKEVQWKSFSEKQDVVMDDTFEEDKSSTENENTEIVVPASSSKTNEKVDEPSGEDDGLLNQANVNDDEPLEPMEIVPISSEFVEPVPIESNSSLPEIDLQDKI